MEDDDDDDADGDGDEKKQGMKKKKKCIFMVFMQNWGREIDLQVWNIHIYIKQSCSSLLLIVVFLHLVCIFVNYKCKFIYFNYWIEQQPQSYNLQDFLIFENCIKIYVFKTW